MHVENYFGDRADAHESVFVGVRPVGTTLLCRYALVLSYFIPL